MAPHLIRALVVVVRIKRGRRRRGAAAAAAVLDEDQWQRIEKASDGAKVLSRPTKEFPVDKEKTNSTGSSSSNCRG